MGSTSQFIQKWIACTSIVLALTVFVRPAPVKGQPLPNPIRGAPYYETALDDSDRKYTNTPFDADTPFPSFGYSDLKTDQLPDSPGKQLQVSRTLKGSPESSGSVSLDHDSGSMVQSVRSMPPETNVQWRSAIQESLFLIGIGHTFDLATQPGTRDAMTGPWLNDYLHSVGELRGWSDSDRFMAPYVAHPIQGAAFGFIERQNDSRYRNVRWGDGREYFMSLLQSMAYAAIWHTEWKIGPISEASIGNVMLHASPGFICLVDTATLGTIAMMAEDAADRYLVTGLENRTSNRLLIVLARGFLNPARSTAQAMALHYPWRREGRLNLTGEDYQLRKELVAEYKAGGEKPFVYVPPPKPQFEREYPKEADIELTAFPVYERFLGAKATNNCVGGGGSGASRLNPYFQLIGEVSGCLIMGMPAENQSGDMLFWGGGVRWTPSAAHRVSPYLQMMFGGRRVTHETLNPELRTELLNAWDDGDGPLQHYPKRSDYSVEVSKYGPALGFGTGFDWVVTRAFAWRMFNVEYTHTWMGDIGSIEPQNSLRITTGAVLRIGTW